MKKSLILLGIVFFISSCALFKPAPKEEVEPEMTEEELRLTEAENYVSDGISYHHAGNDSMAVSSWRKALEIVPDDAEVHNFLGISLHSLDRIEDALVEFKIAVSLNTDYYQAYNNAGYMLFLLNKYDEALVYFNKSLAADPNFEPAIRNRKLVKRIISGNLSKKVFEIVENATKEIDYEKQIIEYRKVLEIDSTYAKAHNNIAVAYYYEDCMDSAKYHLAKAIEYKKNYPEAINNLGYLHKVDEDYETAIKLFLKALTLKPRYIGALNNLGETYTLNGEINNAKRVFTTVLDLEPKNIVAKEWLATINKGKE